MKKITLSICLLYLSFFGFSQVQLGNDINGEATFDNMGWDVALSGDGQTVVVGAPGSSVGAYGAGQVKVLRYDGLNWVQLGSDLLGFFDEDNFGRAVDITNDGNTIIVGAQYSDANGFNSGSTQVFEFDGTNWILKGNILTGVSNDEFGTSVSISNDGNRIAVGAPYTNTSELDNGVLRIFDYNGSQWNLVFEHFGDDENDVFGMSLDMSGDGNHVICGAWINLDGTTKEGYVKVFQFDNSVWSQVGQTISGEVPGIFTGASSSISDNGSVIAVGSWGNDENGDNSGEVEAFELVNNTWQQLGADIQGSGAFERFGWAIDLSSSGTILAVGAPQENNTRFFKFENGNWNMLGNAISGAAVNDDFGFSVDLSSDGTKVLIGDPNNNVNGSDSGFVQVYDITDVLSVEEFKSDLFKVFPNPTSSNLTIQSKVNIREIRIIDINGRLLNNFDAINEDHEISISVENLSNGVYFLKLQIENSEQIIRFVKS
jgi:hypothetical protein